MRIDKRDAAEMRPVTVTTGYLLTAEGSVLIEVGNTRVLSQRFRYRFFGANPHANAWRLGIQTEPPCVSMRTTAAGIGI